MEIYRNVLVSGYHKEGIAERGENRKMAYLSFFSYLFKVKLDFVLQTHCPLSN